MRTMDFTPAWYRTRQDERRGSEGRSAALLVVLVLALTWTFDAVQRSQAADRARGRLHAALESQAPILGRMQGLQVEEAAQERHQQILREIRGNVPVHEILAELSHLQPDAVFLQTIRLARRPNWADRAPSGGVLAAALAARPDAPESDLLEITGWAATGAEVGAFVRALDASALCRAVSLRFERPSEVAGQSVREFQVLCTMPQFE